MDSTEDQGLGEVIKKLQESDLLDEPGHKWVEPFDKWMLWHKDFKAYTHHDSAEEAAWEWLHQKFKN